MLSFIVFVPCVFTIIETPFMLSASATIPKVDYHFVITGSPSSITAGQSFSGVTVTVYRNDGHIKTDYHGRVYFCSTDSQATLPYSSLNS
jgi:hypothetical protein